MNSNPPLTAARPNAPQVHGNVSVASSETRWPFDATLGETAERYTRVFWWALVIVVISGVSMLFGDTVRNLLNSIFWIKMVLVVVGILLAIGYANGLKRQTVAGGGEAALGGAKTAGIFLIILWCVIILAGRWIAYADYLFPE